MLGTNFRSAHALVSAVNTWFAQAEQRPGAGAFGFRDAADNALPFEAVAAKGRDEVFQADGGVAPALLIHHDLALRGTGEVRRLFAARCAERIVAWLNDEHAGFQAPGKDFQRLRPADIAVLVRTGREAAEVRRALRRRGVASVYLSDKDSVFASDEARDLLHWLRAAASPLDARLVRAALATRTVGLSIDLTERTRACVHGKHRRAGPAARCALERNAAASPRLRALDILAAPRTFASRPPACRSTSRMR